MSTATSATARQMNLVTALKAVHQGPPSMTRGQLAATLNCTRATARSLVAELAELGFLAELRMPSTGARGRPRLGLGVAETAPSVVAIHLGHDAARVGRVKLGGKAERVRELRFPSTAPTTVLPLVRRALAAELRRGPSVLGVGIAVHGLVNQRDSTVSEAPSLEWRGVELAHALGLAGREHVYVDNVVHCLALAESARGAPANSPSALFVHADVGLGGALCVRGSLVLGKHGFAGEFGHMPFGIHGRRCACGRSGCWETETDQLALARAAGRRAIRPRAAEEARRIFDGDLNGDAACQQAVTKTALSLGRGIAALITAIDPHMVVLADHAADLFRARTNAIVALAQGVVGSTARDLPAITCSEIGPDAALVGAAEAVFGTLWSQPELFSKRHGAQHSRPSSRASHA